MAKRINTKFVIILVVALVVLTIGLAGAWWMATRHDPAEYTARGDEMMTQQKYEDALTQYARALRYDKDNITIIMKYIDALRSAPVNDSREAGKRIQSMIGQWQRVVGLAPESEHAKTAQRELLEFYYDYARSFQEIGAWDQLLTQTEARLRQNPEDAQALKYRGIAGTTRMQRMDLLPDDREQALEDLQAAREQRPDDAELVYQIAVWHAAESRFQQRAGFAGRAEQLQADALDLVRDFAEEHPEDVDARLNLVKLMLALNRRDEAMPQIERLETMLLNDGHPQRTIEVARLIMGLDTETTVNAEGEEVRGGVARAEELLRHNLDRHPEHLESLLTLATVMLRQGEVDQAIDLLRRAMAERQFEINVRALRVANLQVQATVELANTYLMQYDRADDPQRKDELLAKTSELVKQLEDRLGTSGWVNLIQGKMALARGELSEAVQKLDSANVQFDGGNTETIRLLAVALERLGEIGGAADRLKQLIATPQGSNYVPAYVALANIYFRLNELDQARHHIDQALQRTPESRKALQVKSLILAREAEQLDLEGRPGAKAKFQEAIDIVERLPQTSDRGVALQLGRLYTAADRPGDAVRVLEAAYEENPEDLVLLQQLVRLDLARGEKESAMARVEAAREINPDSKVIELLQDQLGGGSDIAQRIERFIDEQEDPFERKMALWQLYRRTNRAEQAAKALEEAAQLKPNAPRVLKARFDAALRESRWNQAQDIAEKAAELNLDQAEGMFWFGRLEMARGRHTQAVAILDRGVNKFPSYSRGWRLLGDARRLIGDMTAAEEAYDRALELKPNSVDTLQRLFVIHNARGLNQLALDDLRRAVSFAPNNRQLYERYLGYLSQHGDRNRALQLRRRLAERNPGNEANRRAIAALLLRMDRPDEAKQTIDALIEQTGRTLPNVSALAQYHLSTGDFEAGRKVLVDYIERQGEDAEVTDWLTLARFLRSAGQQDGAEAAYRRAAELEGENRPATRELADWAFGRGQFLQAEQLYQSVLESQADQDSRVWRRYVETLVRAGEFDEARNQLQELAEAHGEDVQTSLLEGVVAAARGDEEIAERAFDRAVELSPTNPQAYLYRAQFKFNDGNPATQAQVVEDLRRAVELDPELTPAHALLVQYYVRRDDLPSAIDQLRRLIAEQPGNMQARAQLAQLYLQHGDFGRLGRLLSESEKRLPGTPVWAQMRAELNNRRGRPEQAVQALTEAYEIRPAPQTMAALAEGLIRANQPTQALQLLRQEPDWLQQAWQLRSLQGRALAAAGRKSQAVNAFTAAFELAGTNIQAVGQAATTVIQSLGREQAEQILAERAKSDVSGQSDLLLAQVRLSGDDREQAVQSLENLRMRLGADHPLMAQLLRLLASAHYQAGDYEKSRDAYEALLETSPNDMTALNNLAYMLAEDMGQPEQALPLAQQAVELAPRDEQVRANVYDTLGWIQHLTGNHQEAEAALRRSIRFASLPANHLHLADVLKARGLTIQAMEELNLAQQLAEENNDEATLKQIRERMKMLSSGG